MAVPSKQVRLPFDRLTETNLKPIVKKFTKWGLEIVSIDAPNKAKRESGFLLKNFTLEFKDGQKLLVRVKSDGTVFQVKLNNKVVPVKNVDDMEKAVGEMIDYVMYNAKAYERAKLQREKRKKLNIKTPSVTTSRKEKIAKAKAQLSELNGSNTDLEKQLAEIQNGSGNKNSELEAAKAALAKEKARTIELEKTLAELQGDGDVSK